MWFLSLRRKQTAVIVQEDRTFPPKFILNWAEPNRNPAEGEIHGPRLQASEPRRMDRLLPGIIPSLYLPYIHLKLESCMYICIMAPNKSFGGRLTPNHWSLARFGPITSRTNFAGPVSGETDSVVFLPNSGRILVFLLAAWGRFRSGSCASAPGHGAAEMARGFRFDVPAGALLRER
jgi:hypothetical protein